VQEQSNVAKVDAEHHTSCKSPHARRYLHNERNAAVASASVLDPMLEERRWTVLGHAGDMNRHMRRGGGLEYKNSRTPSTIETSSSPSLIRRIQQLSHIDYPNPS